MSDITGRRKPLASIVWFSIIASVLTISIKSGAYYLTGSVGFMSDAMESLVNLVAGIVAFVALTIASRPADREHPFGHDKAEYFSSLIEGVLILLAAVGIIYSAINRLYHPRPLEDLGYGMALSILATSINFATARVLLHYGKKHDSITLEADAHHLMTDVWTTLGIVAGIVMVKFTSWQLLDPLMAIAVGCSIIYTGGRLVVRSADGLMDSKLSEKELILIKQVLDRYRSQGIDYHALYTRQASSKRFVTFHLLFPGDMTVLQAHKVSKTVEEEIASVLPHSDVFIHIEPMNDPDAFDDILNTAK